MKREFVSDMKRLAAINKTIENLFAASEEAYNQAQEAGKALDLCMDLLINKWNMTSDDTVYDHMLFLDPADEEKLLEDARFIWNEYVPKEGGSDDDG